MPDKINGSGYQDTKKKCRNTNKVAHLRLYKTLYSLDQMLGQYQTQVVLF